MACVSGLPSAAFHRNRRLSAVPAATVVLFGAWATDVTAAAGPVNCRSSWPLAKAETRTVLSALARRIWLPSGERTTAVTVSPWGGKARDTAGGSCQNFTRPSLPALYACVLFGCSTTLLTAPVWAPTVPIGWPLAAFQKRTVRSLPLLAS